MVQYSCSICNKSFKQKIDYTRHLNRKYICKKKEIDNNKRAENSTVVPNPAHNKTNIENKNTCEYCDKQYKRKSELNRHLKTCKVKEIVNIKENIYNLLLEEQNKKLEGQNLYLHQKIQLLEDKYEKAIKIKNVITHSNINSNNTINILSFNDTDTSHITDKDYERIMNKCFMSVPALIHKTHYDPKKPENHNIFITNMKDRHVVKRDRYEL